MSAGHEDGIDADTVAGVSVADVALRLDFQPVYFLLKLCHASLRIVQLVLRLIGNKGEGRTAVKIKEESEEKKRTALEIASQPHPLLRLVDPLHVPGGARS